MKDRNRDLDEARSAFERSVKARSSVPRATVIGFEHAQVARMQGRKKVPGTFGVWERRILRRARARPFATSRRTQTLATVTGGDRGPVAAKPPDESAVRNVGLDAGRRLVRSGPYLGNCPVAHKTRPRCDQHPAARADQMKTSSRSARIGSMRVTAGPARRRRAPPRQRGSPRRSRRSERRARRRRTAAIP